MLPAIRSLALVALVASTLVGCAVNPATGKRELSLISEQQEIAMGLQNDRVIVGQMGLYDDDALQDYIQQLGTTMAAQSERPSLDWTFRVVDDPVVNAFALPGGFIYITRGIMAHLNSEAQLAAVVGHEIGHVTAKHGVSQMSKAQLAQLGVGLGSVFAPEYAQNFGGLVQQGLGLLFLKYGRDDEREADSLGLRYIDRVGYDPRPMPEVFQVLKRAGEAAGAQPLPQWMSSHPAPDERTARLAAAIAESGADYSDRKVAADSYMRRLDGMVFGEDPRQGFFRDTLFIQPEMDFELRFPSGWRTQNQPSAVLGMATEQDAIIALQLSDETSAAAALNKFFEGQGIQRGREWRSRIGGAPAASAWFQVADERSPVAGLVAYIEYGGRIFALLAYSAGAKFDAYSGTFEAALGSFGRVSDRSALNVQPQRIDIVRADRNQSLAAFASRHGSSAELALLELINQVDPGGSVVRGRSYKLIKGSPPR